MRTWKTVETHREGENMGPLDPNFDWMGDGCLFPNNPEIKKERFEWMLEIEKEFRKGKRIHASYGDFGGEVLDIGMYDGWPYWTPTPAVLLDHWNKAHWEFWYEIHEFHILPGHSKGRSMRSK